MRPTIAFLAVCLVAGCGKRISFVEAEAIHRHEVQRLADLEDEYRIKDNEAIEEEANELGKRFWNEERPRILADWNKLHKLAEGQLTEAEKLTRDVAYIKVDEMMRSKYKNDAMDGKRTSDERLELKKTL